MANKFARTLRKNETDAEQALWRGLREFKLANLHFRRQAPIGPYVADFACHRAKVIVELDGDQHGTDEGVAYDAERTAFLEARGYRVIRFANWEVLKERQRVLDYILHVATSPHPDRRYAAIHPPRVGGG
jgi:very-short-patch-repair endonuclease